MGSLRCRLSSQRLRLHGETLATFGGETPDRLHDYADWRCSWAFTEREKAALNLSASISTGEPEQVSPDTLQEARRHFDTSEMVRLTLAILAVNDWIHLDSPSPIRVLVVEDDPSDRELLHRQLQKNGLEKNVTFIPDGREALKLLTGSEGEAFRRSLVAMFLDIHLPGMNGIELLRHIRALPGMENFPVMVMTSSNDPNDLEECKKLKVASYVEKPITFSSFSKAIANVFHSVKA